MGTGQPTKGVPKVGPTKAHLRGRPPGLYKQEGGAIPLTLAPLLVAAISSVHEALVVLADLAIRRATLLPVRVDFVELLRLLHKDEPFVRWFTQLHCRLPSALHRRATEVPQPRV